MHRFSTAGAYDQAMIYRIDITARLQHRMLEIVGTALPLITRAKADADLVGLAHLRGEMVEAIEAYCRHVHALSDANGPTGATASLIAGCTDLRAAYETFRARWVHRASIEHWHEYRLSAVVMMKQVRTLVEEAEGIGDTGSEAA